MPKEHTVKPRYPQIEFDKLQLYFGKPYTIDVADAKGVIVLTPPTLGTIMEYGEKNFYSSLNMFITNTTSYRLVLWESGMDWNEITDFQLFCMLYPNINPEVSKILLNGVDITSFELFQKEGENEERVIILYNSDLDIEINEAVYQHIAQYLREAFSMCPEEKLTKDRTLKELYIRKDQSAIENAKKKKTEASSSIQPLISACVNHPGFKYKLQELKEVGVYEFYDSVKRLRLYENTTALLKGMMGGMIDTSKLPEDATDFMKEI